jgi:hypothetical protein
LYLAKNLHAFCFHSGNYGFKIVNGKGNMPDTGGMYGELLNPDFIGRRKEFDEFQPCPTVWCRDHDELRSNILQPQEIIQQFALHFGFAQQLKSKIEEKCCRGGKIIDDDTDVIDSLELHTCAFRRKQVCRRAPYGFSPWQGQVLDLPLRNALPYDAAVASGVAMPCAATTPASGTNLPPWTICAIGSCTGSPSASKLNEPSGVSKSLIWPSAVLTAA